MEWRQGMEAGHGGRAWRQGMEAGDGRDGGDDGRRQMEGMKETDGVEDKEGEWAKKRPALLPCALPDPCKIHVSKADRRGAWLATRQSGGMIFRDSPLAPVAPDGTKEGVTGETVPLCGRTIGRSVNDDDR